MATLPQQPPGPGPTAQPLPSYLSYSAADTATIAYTSTLTQVVYDPQGSFAPYQTVSVVQGTTTSVDYEVVNVPLLYTGPFPAPDLGTLYTTPGQTLTAQAGATSATNGASSATATGASGDGSASTGGATVAGTDTSSLATATSTATSAGAPTETSATPLASTTVPTGQNTATAGTTQSDPFTVESAPSTSATPSQSGTLSSTATQATSPTASPTTTAPTTTDTSNSSLATNPSSSSGTGTTSNPSATAAGTPDPNTLASSSLSGGQIAGIVLGAFFFLLLLLLLLLCCLRRRRKRRQGRAILAAATGSGGGGGRGNYSTLDPATDWESDNLTGGDGFFVVGGRRVSSRQASTASRRSNSHYPTANIPPSIRNTSGWTSLAAAGAGFFGAAFGKRRERERGRVEIEEEDDDDLGDGSTAERRGLMPFHDSPRRGAEMREGSGRVFAPPTAVLAGMGGAAYGAHRQGTGEGSPSRSRSATYGGVSRPTSSALSGSNSSGSHTQRGLVSSSNSTGGFTTSASPTSLPPPPRPPRTSPTAVTDGNVEPSHGPPFAGSSSQPQRLSAGTTDSTAFTNSALLGLGSGGLGALAAGHRESDGSYARRKPVPSHASELSAEELGHLRSTDPERYSRFISTGSTLLGPGYRSSPEEEGSPGDESTPPGGSAGAGGGGSASQPTRLATIRSVGDMGEARQTSGAYGSLGASSGSRHVVSPLPVYEPQGENLPHYTADRRYSGTEEFKTPLSELPARFDTPPDSPDQTLTNEGRRLEESDRSGAELAETSAASAGILGGVAAGWRRLTMGQYAWVPASTRDQEASSSSVDVDEARGSYDQRPSEDSSRLVHRGGRGSRVEASEPDPVPTSQRASVYGPSALGHGTSSKDASGSSGERAAVQRSYPSLSSHHSSNRSRGGYSSSSGRRTTSDGTGLDSLSAAAQPSTGSASHRSSSHGRSGFSEVSLGSMETGAASYSPSAGALSRDNTTSTRNPDESVATYAPSRRSGEASSVGVTDSDVASSMTTGGSSSLERRKRPRSGDGMSRLDSLREGEEANDPFEEVEAMEELPPTGGHYPSATLGDAVSRSAARDSQPGGEEGYLGSQRLHQRSRIRTLQPGTSAPAQTALAPSLSHPSLRESSATGPHHPQLPSAGSGSNIPASASWRPSPRVASASQHAAEALLRPQQQPQGPRDGGPTPPRSEASGTQHRGASYSWADADVETTAAAHTPGEESQSDEEDRWNRSFDWPKFLKF